MPIANRYQRLLARRAPSEDRLVTNFSESYERERGEYTKYLLGAMRPVDPKYTKRLAEQGDRVENQLTKQLRDDYPGLEFRRQGSVSNLTHIKYYSDVDVLTIIDKFHTVEPPNLPRNPYAGDPKDDLLTLRQDCAAAIRHAFPAVDVDDDGSTCVSLSGGSLVCDVDVVPANWYDTVQYVRGDGDFWRGIMVLNRDEMERIRNRPFLFNERIDTHDRQRLGIPRMLIRLLKSIKADYEEDTSGQSVPFSSFDICSVVYRMPDPYLTVQVTQPLHVIRNLIIWLQRLHADADLQRTLKVVDDSRLIFDEPTKAAGLAMITSDLVDKFNGALHEQGNDRMITNAHYA